MSPLWVSVRVAFPATAVAAVFGVGIAYALAKARFPGRGAIEALVTAPMVLPPTVLGYYLLVSLGATSPVGRAWQRLTGHPIVFTLLGATIAAAISALPFVIRAARAAIEAVDARVEQAGRTMGLAEWRVAAHITLPLARRGILAGIGLGFARALGDFGATVMVAGNLPGRTQTLPVAVYDAVQAGNRPDAARLSLLLVAVAVGVLVMVNRWSRPAR